MMALYIEWTVLIYHGGVQNKKCKGRLRTDSVMSSMNAINLEHNHEQDEKKLKDSICDLEPKGKQRTISPPGLQKSLGLSYINLLISL